MTENSDFFDLSTLEVMKILLIRYAHVSSEYLEAVEATEFVSNCPKTLLDRIDALAEQKQKIHSYYTNSFCVHCKDSDDCKFITECRRIKNVHSNI
jgi:hypothetical protein